MRRDDGKIRGCFFNFILGKASMILVRNLKVDVSNGVLSWLCNAGTLISPRKEIQISRFVVFNDFDAMRHSYCSKLWILVYCQDITLSISHQLEQSVLNLLELLLLALTIGWILNSCIELPRNLVEHMCQDSTFQSNLIRAQWRSWHESLKVRRLIAPHPLLFNTSHSSASSNEALYSLIVFFFFGF